MDEHDGRAVTADGIGGLNIAGLDGWRTVVTPSEDLSSRLQSLCHPQVWNPGVHELLVAGYLVVEGLVEFNNVRLGSQDHSVEPLFVGRLLRRGHQLLAPAFTAAIRQHRDSLKFGGAVSVITEPRRTDHLAIINSQQMCCLLISPVELAVLGDILLLDEHPPSHVDRGAELLWPLHLFYDHGQRSPRTGKTIFELGELPERFDVTPGARKFACSPVFATPVAGQFVVRGREGSLTLPAMLAFRTYKPRERFLHGVERKVAGQKNGLLTGVYPTRGGQGHSPAPLRCRGNRLHFSLEDGAIGIISCREVNGTPTPERLRASHEYSSP